MRKFSFLRNPSSGRAWWFCYNWEAVRPTKQNLAVARKSEAAAGAAERVEEKENFRNPITNHLVVYYSSSK